MCFLELQNTIRTILIYTNPNMHFEQRIPFILSKKKKKKYFYILKILSKKLNGSIKQKAGK